MRSDKVEASAQHLRRRAPQAGGALPAAIGDAVAVLRDAAHPARIILFGSYARGEQTADSDVDVMVVGAEGADTEQGRDRLRALVPHSEPAIEVLSVDRAKFDYWRDTPGNVYYEAAHEGRELYRAAGELDSGRDMVVRSREQAAMYLRLAGGDIALLESVLEIARVPDAIFGFHAQQAAEKLFKGVLSAHRIRTGKIYSIQELMKRADAHGLNVPSELSTLSGLSKFAVDGRYQELGATLDRRALLAKIASLRQWAESTISTAPESGPPRSKGR